MNLVRPEIRSSHKRGTFVRGPLADSQSAYWCVSHGRMSFACRIFPDQTGEIPQQLKVTRNRWPTAKTIKSLPAAIAQRALLIW